MKLKKLVMWILFAVVALSLCGCGIVGKTIEGTGSLIQSTGRTVRNI